MKKRSTGRPRTNPIPPHSRDEEPPPRGTVLEHIADDASFPMPDSSIFAAMGLDQGPPIPPPKRRPMTKRELVAHHEFAHVFVASIYGMKVTHASIESGCRDKVSAHVAGRTRFQDDSADFESIDWCRSFATICLAGDAAEHILLGKRNACAASLDNRLAARALRKETCGEVHMLEGLLKFLFYRVRSALVRYWDVVEFGAQKLLKKGSLTESEIEEIIFDGEHPCHSAA